MDYHHRLSWSPSTAPPIALPEGVQREYLPSPSGVLELLTSSPLRSGEGGGEKEPLLFIHGAKHALALDVALAIAHIRSKHTKNVIIAGHSSGGGLGQYILDRDMEKLGGLVALASVPGFGSMRGYLNWVRLDPWLVIRAYCKHFGHPRSPLSSTTLVHNAFFSRTFPVQAVCEFERAMPEYESMCWSFGMMTKFVSAERVIGSILPTLKGGRRVLVVAGGEDKLMDGVMMQRLAAWYRVAWESIRGKGEEGGEESSEEVVRYGVVEGSGHHVMKDNMWKAGAEMVLEWLEGR